MSLSSVGSVCRGLSVGLCGLCLQGCVADFVAPLSVVSHRYPSIGQAAATNQSNPRRPVVEGYTVAKSDRLPTPREIFDFHPKGLAADQTRQPFLVNPNEGPLRIRSIAAADAVAEQSFPTGSIAGRPPGGLTPRNTVALPRSSFGHQ